MATETKTAAGHDGTELLVRRWPADDATASILLVHGLGEHCGRYEHVGEFFAGRGFDTTGFDQRGFGGAAGKRAYVDEFAEYLADIELMLERLPVRPAVLLGHSLGGLIAYAYAVSDRSPPDLLVLSAPALEANIGFVRRGLARILGRVAPGLSIPNDIKGEQLSSDPAVGEAYFADPLVHTKTTAGLGLAALEAMDGVESSLSQLTVPTLVIHGTADTVVPPHCSAPLTEQPNVERVLLPAFRHESFNEVEKERALSTVADWISSNL